MQSCRARLAGCLILLSCIGVLGAAGAVPEAAVFDPAKPNGIVFEAVDARYVRLNILAGSGSQVCIDELELFGPVGRENVALASAGGKASASSCLSGYAIHRIAHVNDGLYGNSHSWIAAGSGAEWVQIELPRAMKVGRLVFSRDREGKLRDRMPTKVEVSISLDGLKWKNVAARQSARPPVEDLAPIDPPAAGADYASLLRYAFECERWSMGRVDASDPAERVLVQMNELAGRLAGRGVDVSRERLGIAALRDRLAKLDSKDIATRNELFLAARMAKRDLFFRDPQLDALQKVLFIRRHPYRPSHNYSDLLDATGPGGGGICVLEIPKSDGRLNPGAASVRTLFDSGKGVARDVSLSADAKRIFFAYAPTKGDYFHLVSMDDQGGSVKTLTDGPFNDVYPLPLPDGGLAFISTRCRARFLCWRPQAYVLFRMEADGQTMRPLSYANLSEWAPSLMPDGRILWTRSEYLDKGADFGHTLWTVRPDGTHCDLLFGNNTRNCYVGAKVVPGTGEILCTLFSHGGDLNGPIALLRPEQGRFNPQAVKIITPDSKPHYNMNWARRLCFRDPTPISSDLFLVSHAPQENFGLYVIDRQGNRELLHMDAAISCMAAIPMSPGRASPVPRGEVATEDAGSSEGTFFIADVHRGLEPAAARGSVKYIRVCQELRADLEKLPSGEYRKDHPPFTDFYATPIHKVSGPMGWPSYVAKGVVGIAPVEEDGSAHFTAPAGKVLYFQALDANLNEVQRMRSVVQLQPGEKRGCVGCHEDRSQAPPLRPAVASRRAPSTLEPPPWGAGPFAYEKIVQKVWDAQCVRCHDEKDKGGINLSAAPDGDKVPASYRTLIGKGFVHYFDCRYQLSHSKAPPPTFGSVRSPLVKLLEKGHYDVKLTHDQMHAIKCWIDLNCPLWPDYLYRPERKVALTPPGR